MANIVEKVRQIRQAIYGKDVRESIASGLEEMNAECNETVETTTEQLQQINAMASRIESAEQIRVQNETARISNEDERLSKELERIAAETQRLVKEQDRIESESIRIENENQRIDDENERKQAEQRRVVSEINRVNEEKGRQTNETVRNSSESNRLSNENARKEAESNRVTAENARVTAETKRQTDTSAVIERATTAAERCEEFIEELDGKVNVSDIDATLSATSTNPIQNKAVYEALQNIDVSGGGDTLPIGIIVPYASDTAPDGWLLCNGTAVSRTEYSELFSVIGTTYGAGNGTDTFHVPDMRGRVPVGLHFNDVELKILGKQGGSKTHTITVDEMPSHTHAQNAHKHTASGSTGEAGSHNHNASSNSTGSHTHTVSGTAASAGEHAHSLFAANAGGAGTSPTGNNFAQVGSSNKTTWYNMPMSDAGSHTHTVSGTATSAGGHSHTITVTSNGAHTHTVSVTVSETTATNQNTGGGQAHNNMQPYMVVNYIIKY